MKNLFRSLLFDEEISLTLADTTDLVQRGMDIHALSPDAAILFGKALSAATFMSACLKEESGEISLSLQASGGIGNITISGNQSLYIRGTVENPQAKGSEQTLLGEGAFTVIRQDGYHRPFVGTCAFPAAADMDGLVEEYYRVSEQLPTRIQTSVRLDEQGKCSFAGVVALQPLPFASAESLERYKNMDLTDILERLRLRSVEEIAEGSCQSFATAEYRCHCSREYLLRALVTLGEEELREIIKEEGAVRAHCHYCNKDYEFTDKDVDLLFRRK